MRFDPSPGTMISGIPSSVMSPIAGCEPGSVRAVSEPSVQTFVPSSPRITRRIPFVVYAEF